MGQVYKLFSGKGLLRVTAAKIVARQIVFRELRKNPGLRNRHHRGRAIDGQVNLRPLEVPSTLTDNLLTSESFAP